jgi:NADH:ubiquinone oxidoreductase subunit 3 (subunit A)
MKTFLLSPVVAFLIYFLVVLAVSGLGKLFSATGRKSQFKSATYASGEENDPVPAAPGYRQFFVVALFFAILHLGVLMIGSSDLSSVAAIYLLGLILALIALILG